MTRTPDNNCCENWRKAQEQGTDSEGCYNLLEHYDYVGPTKGWHIGSDLPPIKFCPWCGRKVSV